MPCSLRGWPARCCSAPSRGRPRRRRCGRRRRTAERPGPFEARWGAAATSKPDPDRRAAALLVDMERLRELLNVDRWLLYGGSWGSSLLLAYAQRHPERVSEIVVNGVTTTRRSEIDWLYRGVARFFPEEWERFMAGVPEAGRDGDAVAAYARRMNDPDPMVRAKAADDWCAWEDAVVSCEPNGPSGVYSGRAPAARIALVRIASHYFAHGAWLEEGALLRNAARLTGIPGVLVHGRLDLSSPPDTAWELCRAWPDARLVTVGDAGHLGSDAADAEVLAALDRFAGRP
ncbi:alpha/beta fold hydrolase [Streptomyces chengbuensis]|uniref:alpha/beta fold hydrolase n=1 Tax=Streptomyces chengbuensis TaxID=3053466 RepID=UPI0025B4B084|nr:alpha/beta fold hydrolase [Streptomyces sp. HUAS CB01]WJY48805.1 alpha/beta fold hydrolase [Streptomyces sp. HUAS CB01]